MNPAESPSPLLREAFASGQAPSFTVVIPTCNRPAMLATCLGALPPGASVIVSDDSATPDARWLAGPRRGPAANRNHGARAATSEWLAFLDDDCEPQPGWLAALAAAADGADVIEGRTLTPGGTDSPFEEHVENLHGGSLWSCNLAVRRDVFERLGGFDEDFAEAGGEDMEFAWRVRRAGLRVRFAPEALVHHPPRRIGWRGLWRRTWMIRWMAVYRLKVGEASPPLASCVRECMGLLRSTAHLVTRPEPHRWRRRIFTVAWRWFTFPLVLPYILYWERRCRELVR